MTTFDDDHLVFDDGPYAGKRAFLRDVGLEWPPPLVICVEQQTFVREHMSMLPDFVRAQIDHVCRGALYRLATARQVRERLAAGDHPDQLQPTI